MAKLLHLIHSDWQFGIDNLGHFPLGFFLSNLDSRHLKWPWSCQKLTNFKSNYNMSKEMSQGVLSPNLTEKNPMGSVLNCQFQITNHYG